VEARVIRIGGLCALALAAAAIAGCGRGDGDADRLANGATSATLDAPRAVETVAGVTPMAERVAVLGLLNKRNGIVRDITLKPGEAIRFRDAVVRLRACDATAPWDNERLTGAFVQLDVEQPGGAWKRVFSGWRYKESPSLNVVEHPVYDVWPKSCAIKWPDAPGAPATPAETNNRSSAAKSGGGALSRPGTSPAARTARDAQSTPSEPETPTPAPEPTAEASNAT
jgi:hypothetical protein